MRHITFCGLPGSIKSFHIILQTARFSKKIATEHKKSVLIFSTTFVWNISHSEKNWARCDRKCVAVFTSSTGCSCHIFTTLKFSEQSFVGEKKKTKLKYQISPKSVQCEPFCCTRTDGQTDMTKLTVGFPAILRTSLKSPCQISAYVAQVDFPNDLYQRNRTLYAKAVGVWLYGVRNGSDCWDVTIMTELYRNTTRVTLWVIPSFRRYVNEI